VSGPDNSFVWVDPPSAGSSDVPAARRITGDGVYITGGGDLSKDQAITLTRDGMEALDNLKLPDVNYFTFLGAAPNSGNVGQRAYSWYKLGELAHRDYIDVFFIDAQGRPDATTYLRGDGVWATPAKEEAVLPAGMIAPFAMEIPPDGWLECNGQAVSRTIYANLFAAIGTWWGDGDETTTFNIPDFRAQFLRGWDNGKNQDETPNRAFATWQESANLGHMHTGNTSYENEHDHGYGRFMVYERGQGFLGGLGRIFADTVQATTKKTPAHSHTLAVENAGGRESRPINFAVLYCIKT